jgi:hypothetical protein
MRKIDVALEVLSTPYASSRAHTSNQSNKRMAPPNPALRKNVDM